MDHSVTSIYIDVPYTVTPNEESESFTKQPVDSHRQINLYNLIYNIYTHKDYRS